MSRLQVLLGGLPRLNPAINPDLEESKKCATFPQFPKLPNEIRDKVWEMASYHPRYVKLFLHNGDRESFPDVSDVPGQSRIPTVLQVNRESRSEALRHYFRVYERPRYKRVKNNGESSGVWYRSYNDLRMNRPAVETKAMRPNILYINFVADQFLQHPMKNRFGKVTVSNFNFPVEVLFKIKNLDICHLFDGGQWDFDNVTTLLPYLKLDSLSFFIGAWTTMQRFNFEERFDGHLAIQKSEDVFDKRLEDITTLWKKASNYTLPENMVIKWESREDTELTAWPSNVERFRSKDRALKKTWERALTVNVLP